VKRNIQIRSLNSPKNALTALKKMKLKYEEISTVTDPCTAKHRPPTLGQSDEASISAATASLLELQAEEEKKTH
jgi:hypothetical protein